MDSSFKKYLVLAFVGFFLAIAVAMYLQQNIGTKEAPVVDDGNDVLIAKTDLTSGTFIVGGVHLDWKAIPESQIKPEYLLKKSFNPAQYEGAVVRKLIEAGTPISKELVVTPRDGGFLSAVLQPNMRAISVGVDVVSANAGFIFPGDKVDLLLTHEIDTPNGEKSHATETFVEDVRVLAIDQHVSNPDNKAVIPKTVTLEVTPKQAEEVLVAEELGKISLILRSVGSVTITDVKNVVEKTYTKDNEVSRVINEYKPNPASITSITITRGKVTSNVSLEKAQ